MAKRGGRALPGSVAEALREVERALLRVVEGEASDGVVAEVEKATADALYAARLAGAQHRQTDELTQSVDFGSIIAGHVREYRRTARWPQERLAEAMAKLGFGWKRLTVVEVEGGARKVALEELAGLAMLFGRPMASFLLPDRTQVLTFPPDRFLVEWEVAALLVGDGGTVGQGGANWESARFSALLRDEDEDWRPAVDLDRYEQEGAESLAAANRRLAKTWADAEATAAQEQQGGDH